MLVYIDGIMKMYRLSVLLLLVFLSSFSAFADPMPARMNPHEEPSTEQQPAEESSTANLGEVRCTGEGEQASCIEV